MKTSTLLQSTGPLPRDEAAREPPVEPLTEEPNNCGAGLLNLSPDTKTAGDGHEFQADQIAGGALRAR